MLTDHRHQEILTRLNGQGRVGVTDVAAVLRVSEETIRRDMKLLEERGLLRRIHGGAVPSRLDQEQPLGERAKINPREKARVAALATTLVRDGMSLFLDTGTSTLAFAQRLVGRQVSVTTNSIDVALCLGGGTVDVKLTPGSLRAKDHALVGYETLAYVGRYFFDMAVVGIAACDLAHGWMDYEEHESVLRRALKAQARRGVILADSGKFGRQATLHTFALHDALTVVTDRPPPVSFGEVFARHGVEVLTSSSGCDRGW